VGDPAHTATHGVNLRIEGRALPLLGRALPPDVPARVAAGAAAWGAARV